MSIEQERLRHMTSAHIRKAAAALTTSRETRNIVWVTVVDGKECPSRQLIYDASELISSPSGLPALSDVVTHEAVAVLSHNGFTSMKRDWM